jgi:hypothetical protein
MGKCLSARLLGSNKLRIVMSSCMSMPDIVHMGVALFSFFRAPYVRLPRMVLLPLYILNRHTCSSSHGQLKRCHGMICDVSLRCGNSR